MLPFEAMPEHNEDLARIQIDFPRLADDTPSSCPVSIGEIVDYLRMEVSDGDTVHETQLSFLRTALVSDH